MKFAHNVRMILIIDNIPDMNQPTKPWLTGLSLVGALFLSSCASSTTSSSTGVAPVERPKLSIAASFYPIEEIVRSVAGDSVDVFGLTPPGEGAHDLELTASQVTRLETADIVFYIGDGFQPGVEKVLSSLPSTTKKVDLLQELTVVDVIPQLEGTEGETDGEVLASGKDPHVWLDPANMATMTRSVASVLSSAAGLDADAIGAAANAYVSELETLGAEFDAGLANCQSRVLVTSHRAFEYLAQRTNLQQVAIAGVNPDEEPSAKSLEAIAKFAAANNVSTIFFETLLPPDLANVIANEIGATTDLLDPIEGFSQEDLDEGASYVVAQRSNLERLRQGLECS